MLSRSSFLFCLTGLPPLLLKAAAALEKTVPVCRGAAEAEDEDDAAAEDFASADEGEGGDLAARAGAAPAAKLGFGCSTTRLVTATCGPGLTGWGACASAAGAGVGAGAGPPTVRAEGA